MSKLLLIWTLLAYLSGSIPFGLLIGQFCGMDIRQHGSGNIGATNVGRQIGRRWGTLCFLLDVLKGLAPVLAAGITLGYVGRGVALSSDQAWQWLAVAAAAMLGHVFPLWLGFKGGKGVATGFGVLLGCYPHLTHAGLVAFATWLIMTGFWRYVSLSSVVAAVSLPVYIVVRSIIFHGRIEWNMAPFVIVTSFLAFLVIIRHRTNLIRLVAGTEPKIGASEPKDKSAASGSCQSQR